MIDLTAEASKEMGKNAAEYVKEHGFYTTGGRILVVSWQTPERIARTLTHIYGRPTEAEGSLGTLYWRIDRLHVRPED